MVSIARWNSRQVQVFARFSRLYRVPLTPEVAIRLARQFAMKHVRAIADDRGPFGRTHHPVPPVNYLTLLPDLRESAPVGSRHNPSQSWRANDPSVTSISAWRSADENQSAPQLHVVPAPAA